MSLTLTDHRALLKGFADAGYCCETEPDAARNPICLEWRLSGGTWHYRLWAFEITHGGGGPTVRAADEFRIQITNGPDAVAELDSGALDLLVGYSPTATQSLPMIADGLKTGPRRSKTPVRAVRPQFK